jgi:hypothetical protein
MGGGGGGNLHKPEYEKERSTSPDFEYKEFCSSPNPFQKYVTFTFTMPRPGTAQIAIYSLYNEKVWESEVIKYSIEGNYTYPFKAEEELQLYELYKVVLTKKYSNEEETEETEIFGE